MKRSFRKALMLLLAFALMLGVMSAAASAQTHTGLVYGWLSEGDVLMSGAEWSFDWGSTVVLDHCRRASDWDPMGEDLSEDVVVSPNEPTWLRVEDNGRLVFGTDIGTWYIPISSENGGEITSAWVVEFVFPDSESGRTTYVLRGCPAPAVSGFNGNTVTWGEDVVNSMDCFDGQSASAYGITVTTTGMSSIDGDHWDGNNGGLVFSSDAFRFTGITINASMADVHEVSDGWTESWGGDSVSWSGSSQSVRLGGGNVFIDGITSVVFTVEPVEVQYDAYEDFATNQSQNAYTGEHFRIDCQASGDGDGFYLRANGSTSATITALNGETITKVELTRGYYEPEGVVGDKGAALVEGDVISITGINDSSLTVSQSQSHPTQIKAVKIYYTGGGSAHTHEDASGNAVTFQAWTETDSLPTSGSWYLTGDVTLGSTWTVSNTVDLCLDGHAITYTGSVGSVISVNGGTLNLYDADGNHGTITGGKGTGSSNANNRQGGGVLVWDDGTFTMYGGTITGNEAHNNFSGSTGGGVCVGRYSTDSGTFNMYGGVISGNFSTNGGGLGVLGGNSVANIYGGTITGNTGYFGDGVIVCGGTLNLRGGTVSGNIHDATLYDNEYTGGGDIFCYRFYGTDPTFNLYDGSVGTILTTAPVNVSGDLGGNVYTVSLIDGSNKYNPKAGVITSGLPGHGSLDNFLNGNGEGYRVRLTAEGEAQIEEHHEHSFTYSWQDNVITATCGGDNCDLTDNKVEITLEEPADMVYDGTPKAPVANGIEAFKAATGLPDSAFTYEYISSNAGGKDPFISGFPTEEGSYTMRLIVHYGQYDTDIVLALLYNYTITAPAHEHDGITFEPWTSNNSLPTDSGSYYLTADVTLSEEWNISGGTTVNLCLNGKKIQGGAAMFIANSAVLNLYDDAGEGSVYGYGDAVVKLFRGTLNLHDVALIGSSNNSYAVWMMKSGSTFNMYGGSITDSYIALNVNESSTFTMTGGSITGNALAVQMEDGSTFTMTGGSITGNDLGVENYGGGTLNLSGAPNITGNRDYDVYLEFKKINVTGALDSSASVGVTMTTPGVFTSGLSGRGDVSNFVSNSSSYGLVLSVDGEAQLMDPSWHYHNGITFEPWNETTSLPTASGNYYLTGDVTISSTWYPANGVNLCLNGHGINRNGGNRAIELDSGRSLTIYDCGDTTHYFDVSNHLATNINETSGTYSFTGGYITGGYANGFYNRGAAFFLNSNASLTMYGGTILGNRSSSNAAGGAISTQNVSGTTINMNGTKIMYNHAQSNIMGAMLLGGNVRLHDVQITNNHADDNLGGLYVGSSGTVVLSGETIIKDNTHGTAGTFSNLVIQNTQTQVGELTGAAEIWMYGNTGWYGVVDGRSFTDSNGKDQIQYFHIDPSRAYDPDTAPDNYLIGVNADGALVMGKAHTVTYDGNGSTGGSVPTDDAHPTNAAVTILGAGSMTREGYGFTGWNTAADGSGTAYAPDDVFTITEDVTLYAQWEGLRYSFSYNENGAEGGALPMADTYTYDHGTTVTVQGNTGDLARSGYAFTGWNTAADGSGTAYNSGNSFEITSDTILYAQWTRTYNVTLHLNGGTLNGDDLTYYVEGVGATLPTDLTREGYNFDGWYDNEAMLGSPVTKIGATATGNREFWVKWFFKAYHVYVVTPDGAKTMYTGMEPSERVSVLKEMIAAQTGVPASRISLSYGGRVLSDNVTLADYNIQKGYTVRATFAPDVVPDFELFYTLNSDVDEDADRYRDYRVGEDVVATIYLRPLSDTVLQAFDIFMTHADGLVRTDMRSQYGELVTEGDRPTNTTHIRIQAIGKEQGSKIEVPIAGGEVYELARVTFRFADFVNYDIGQRITLLEDSNIAIANTPESFTPGIGGDTDGAELRGTYLITFDDNVPDREIQVPVPMLARQMLNETLPDDIPVRPGYIFRGWDKDPEAENPAYQPGGSIRGAEDTTLYAIWDTEMYTVTFYDEDGLTIIQNERYPFGTRTSTIAPDDPVKQGDAQFSYVFKGWEPKLSELVVADAAYTAVYEQIENTYTVIFQNWDGTILQTDTLKYGETPAYRGETPTHPDEPGKNYSFLGWDPAIEPVTCDITYYAQFNPEVVLYTVSFNNNGHGSRTPVSQRIGYGGYVNNPGELYDTGWIFVGWFQEASGENSWHFDSDTVTANTTLYAKWQERQYKMIYVPNGGSGIIPGGGWVPYTQSFALPDGEGMERNGYRFTGWNTRADGSGDTFSPGAVVTVKDNLISYVNGESIYLYAMWTADEYVINYVLDGGQWQSGQQNPVSYNVDQLPLTLAYEPVRTGYSFGGWYAVYTESGQAVSLRSGNIIRAGTAGNLTVTAIWNPAQVEYKVEHYQQYVDGDGYALYMTEYKTGLTGDQTTVEPLDLTGFTAQPFAQKTIEADGSTIVTIYYDRNYHSVSYFYSGDKPDGAPAVPATVRYKYGKSVVMENVPILSGYEFEGWSTEDVQVVNGRFSMPDNDVVFTGQWIALAVPYTVEHWQQNVNDDDYTLVATDSSLTGKAGDPTQAVPNTYTGFTVLPYDQQTILSDGSTVVQIYYNRVTHTVRYSITGAPASMNIPGASEYRVGAYVTVEELEAPKGYTLGELTLDPTQQIDNERRFVMPDEDVTISGACTPVTYTITFDVTVGDLPIEPWTYTIESIDTLPGAESALYRFEGWKVTTEDGNWVLNAVYNANTPLTGKYGNVTLTAQWTEKVSYLVEEYKYAPQGWYMLRIKDNLDMNQSYAFSGEPMFVIDDPNYRIDDETYTFYTLISGTYVEGSKLTQIGYSMISNVEGDRFTVDYNGDVNNDEVVNIADANAVFQMLAQNSYGGYYGIEQLTVRDRLAADMVKSIHNADHRGSIEDVNAIVNLVIGRN